MILAAAVVAKNTKSAADNSVLLPGNRMAKA
jgi:hypothetical protein